MNKQMSDNHSTLAEIDKFVVAKYPLLNSKPALIRAYKRTLSKEAGGDGDDWVEKKEFALLLKNLIFYNRLFAAFDDVDSGDDRRVDLKEFQSGLKYVGMSLSAAESEAEFKEIDKNGGGQVLFDEFCEWYLTQKGIPLAGSSSSSSSNKKKKKKSKKEEPLDDDPDLAGSEFDQLEKEFVAICDDKKELAKLWKSLDFNGNGKRSSVNQHIHTYTNE